MSEDYKPLICPVCGAEGKPLVEYYLGVTFKTPRCRECVKDYFEPKPQSRRSA